MKYRTAATTKQNNNKKTQTTNHTELQLNAPLQVCLVATVAAPDIIISVPSLFRHAPTALLTVDSHTIAPRRRHSSDFDKSDTARVPRLPSGYLHLVQLQRLRHCRQLLRPSARGVNDRGISPTRRISVIYTCRGKEQGERGEG